MDEPRGTPIIVGTKLLHSTGLKYTTNVKVKRVKSKRDLNSSHHHTNTADDNTSSTPKQTTRHASASVISTSATSTSSSSSASSTPTLPSRASIVGQPSPSPGIHRGSIVPLAAVPPITSTNLLMEDDVRQKGNRKKLKRSASERKRAKKSGKEERETEWIYEEKELKVAICCVIA